MFRDKDVTSSKRPAKYLTHEEEQLRRNSSAADRTALRRGSRISASMEDYVSGKTEISYHDAEKDTGLKMDA